MKPDDAIPIGPIGTITVGDTLVYDNHIYCTGMCAGYTDIRETILMIPTSLSNDSGQVIVQRETIRTYSNGGPLSLDTIIRNERHPLLFSDSSVMINVADVDSVVIPFFRYDIASIDHRDTTIKIDASDKLCANTFAHSLYHNALITNTYCTPQGFLVQCFSSDIGPSMHSSDHLELRLIGIRKH
jgi:hypothetical protein